MKKKISHFLFPPLCLHCHTKMEEGLFCKACAFYFEPIDITTRCPYCFQESETKAPCIKCREKKKWHYQSAATFENRGAIFTFQTYLKKGTMPYLAKTAASFLLLQLLALKWQPECIVSYPLFWQKKILHGKSSIALQAKALAKLLDIPHYKILKKSGFLREGGFKLRKKGCIMDKKVLVLNDTFEGREEGMEMILEAAPRRAYFLALTDWKKENAERKVQSAE